MRETTFRPSHGPVLAAPGDSSANVLYREDGILVVLMEQRIARDPRTGRDPTVDSRLRFGAQLIAIMADAVKP